jgi:hypothetical protein
MEETIGPLALVLIIVGSFAVIIGALVWGLKRSKKNRKNQIQKFRETAQKLGFQLKFFNVLATTEFRPRRWEIHGQYKGFKVTAWAEGRKAKGWLSVLRLDLSKPLGMGLVIYKAGLFSKAAKMLRGQDITVGIKELDSLVRIQARDEDSARGLLLRSGASSVIIQLFSELRNCRIDDDHILYTVKGDGYATELVDIARFQEILSRLSATAETLT